MPRTSNWSEDIMDQAIRDLKNGTLTCRTASKCYGIPRATLNDRVRGYSTHYMGPRTILSRSTELLVVGLLIFMADIGLGLSRVEILTVIGNYLVQSCQTHLFPDGIPGKDWYYAFLKRL